MSTGVGGNYCQSSRILGNGQIHQGNGQLALTSCTYSANFVHQEACHRVHVQSIVLDVALIQSGSDNGIPSDHSNCSISIFKSQSAWLVHRRHHGRVHGCQHQGPACIDSTVGDTAVLQCVLLRRRLHDDLPDLAHGQLGPEEPHQRGQAAHMRRRHGGAAEEGVLAAGDGGVDGAARRCHVHRAGPVAAEGGQSPRDRGGGDGHNVPGGVVGRVVGDLVVVGALVPRRGDEEHPGAFRALDGHSHGGG
mmetsp:Transcript_122617/g.291589  ORF Transcript_122617/g.291589 Transcript_122617/m.291589 type:complete len:249 (+) Transcript_122617:2470-3216(+)